MKQGNIDHVIIVHGIGSNPHVMWFPWLRHKLEHMGLHVDVPNLPHSLKPNYKEWVSTLAPFLKKANANTMIIAHSLGAVLALRMLSLRSTKHVGAVVMVGAPIARLMNIASMTPFFDRRIDWERVRGKSEIFIALHAKNDAIVPFDHTLRIAEELGIEPLIVDRGGHFTGISCPLVFEIIEPLLKTS